jgi:hypothetical protein
MSLASKVVDFLCLASEQPDLIIYWKRRKIKIRGLLSEKERKKKTSVCELVHFYTNQILQKNKIKLKKIVWKEETITNKHQITYPSDTCYRIKKLKFWVESNIFETFKEFNTPIPIQYSYIWFINMCMKGIF